MQIMDKLITLENLAKYHNNSKNLFVGQDEYTTLVRSLYDSKILKFTTIEPVVVTINSTEVIEVGGGQIFECILKQNDTFEITPTSTQSIMSLSAWPGALDTYYDWLEGVNMFDSILFNMNNEDFYTKWSQGNQGQYHVQFAQYKNCIFWSDNAYVSDVTKRTNYTLFYTSELPLCYSTIPENTFKSFYCAYGVTNDPNWSNQAYKDSFASATWATQVFSYYGLKSIGMFDMDASYFNITLPIDCRGLMFWAPNIQNAGVFDAINTINFGAKSGSWRDAFGYCYSLENLYIKNLKVNLNVSWSPINQQSLEFILTEAANTSAITIWLSPHTYYGLTEANKTLATEKNITLSLISTNISEDMRLSMLQKTGDGNSYLANDGTYKSIEIPVVPTKVSELENDSNFITSDTAQQMIDDSIANLDTGGSGGGSDTEVSTKGGTTLFEVSTISANFSDVTLSQSSANFTQLDICCCTDVGETIFTSVYNPNGNIFNVSSAIQESGELIIKSKQYDINGSNITTVPGLGGMLSVSSGGISTVDGNYIGIYKVIGY